MSSRAKKWLIFGIIVVLIAGAIGVNKFIQFQKYKVPDGAVLGNLDVSLVQIEPEVIRSLWNDQTTESTTIYVFRPDGGMSIGSLDLAGSGGFYIPNPGNVYFISNNKVYCCSVIDSNWQITDRKTWQAFAIFELRDGVPYIDDNYKINDYDYPLILHENKYTWTDFIAQVQQKITDYESGR